MSNKPDYKALASQPHRRLPHEAFLGNANEKDKESSERKPSNKILNSGENIASNINGKKDINNNSDVNNNNMVASNNNIKNNMNADNGNDNSSKSMVKINNDAKSGLDDILTIKKSDKRYRGFYLSPELDDVLSEIKDKYGKGALSEVVNAILKEGLASRGMFNE